MVVGGVESDYSVCPRPFLQFCQVMSGYIRLCQFMLEGRDVELDNTRNLLPMQHKTEKKEGNFELRLFLSKQKYFGQYSM